MGLSTTTFSAIPAVTAAATGQFAIGTDATGKDIRIPVGGTLGLGTLQGTDPQNFVPTTGQTVTVVIGGGNTVATITPAGTLAALTLTLNNGTSAGQRVEVAFSQIITALSYGGTNITATGGLALPSAATLGQSLGFVWSVANSRWTRFQ